MNGRGERARGDGGDAASGCDGPLGGGRVSGDAHVGSVPGSGNSPLAPGRCVQPHRVRGGPKLVETGAFN